MKKKILVGFMACSWLLGPVLAGAEQDSEKSGEKPLLRTAIFVQNRAGSVLQDQLDVLKDQLTSHLTEKGFLVIDQSVVVAKFRESRETDAAVRKEMKALAQASNHGTNEANVEDAISGASALRIAQIIGADYLVMATINSLGVENRSFKGQNSVYGTDNEATIFNLRIGLKVLEGNQGGTVYGDTVTASERVVAGQNLTIVTSDIMPKLIESGARKIADNIADKVERIRNVKVKTVPLVEFSVSSNVEGAVVELDGAVIGSTPGRFTAAPGLHQLRLTKEWLTPWTRTINIFPNQVLNVSLELSDEGIRRFVSIEQLKTDLSKAKQQIEIEMKEQNSAIGIAKEQSTAETEAKKKNTDGEKAKREESIEPHEGPPTTIYK